MISKPDLVDAHNGQVVATVRQLNPEAQLVVAEKGDLPLDAVLDTGLFDEELGEVNPGWVQALNDEPTPRPRSTASRRSFTAIAGRSIQSALALEGDWSIVLRNKGFFWLATRPDVQAMWSQAGLSVMLEPLAEWMAAVPESEWEFETPEDRIAFDERWDPIVGDRQTEIVFSASTWTKVDPASARRLCAHRSRVREGSTEVDQVQGSAAGVGLVVRT